MKYTFLIVLVLVCSSVAAQKFPAVIYSSTLKDIAGRGKRDTVDISITAKLIKIGSRTFAVRDTMSVSGVMMYLCRTGESIYFSTIGAARVVSVRSQLSTEGETYVEAKKQIVAAKKK